MGISGKALDMRSTIVIMSLCALASLTNGYHGQSVQRMQRESPNSWPPAFCKNLDCPHLTVVKTTEDYVVRKYDASKWATTSRPILICLSTWRLMIYLHQLTKTCHYMTCLK